MFPDGAAAGEAACRHQDLATVPAQPPAARHQPRRVAKVHVMSCHVMSCHLVAQVQLAPAGECDGGRHRGAAAHTGAVNLYACRNQGSPCRFMFQLSQLQLAVSHGAAKQIRQLAGEEGLDLGLPLRGQVTCRHVAGV